MGFCNVVVDENAVMWHCMLVVDEVHRWVSVVKTDLGASPRQISVIPEGNS